MQYPEYQLFEETVLKDISFGPANMGLPREEVEERARFAANMVGLNDSLLEKSPFDLSRRSEAQSSHCRGFGNGA